MRNVQLRSLVLLACAPLALAGCVDASFDLGEPAPGDDDPLATEARARFTLDVYPILDTRCAGCHSESSGGVLGFVGRSPSDGYARILAFPNVVGDFTPIAPILSLPSIGHKGVIYASAERTAIAAWLDAELAERGGGGPLPPPPPTLETLLQTWSGCLDYSDFLASNMTASWNALTTSNGPCKTCHTGAIGGFVVSSDPVELFRLISTRRSTLLTFFQPAPALGVMLPNDPLFLAVGGQVVPYTQHPAFAYTGARTALTALANKTATRLHATPPACSPPRLED